MKGIVLISHGPLARGMYETTKWFMGEEIPQYGYLCLDSNEQPEEFDERLAKAIEENDSGEGVIVIADLFGGTPCNRAAMMIADGKTEVFAGMNLSLVLQLLGNRLSDNYDLEDLETSGKDGIVWVNRVMSSVRTDDNDE